MSIKTRGDLVALGNNTRIFRIVLLRKSRVGELLLRRPETSKLSMIASGKCVCSSLRRHSAIRTSPRFGLNGNPKIAIFLGSCRGVVSTITAFVPTLLTRSSREWPLHDPSAECAVGSR